MSIYSQIYILQTGKTDEYADHSMITSEVEANGVNGDLMHGPLNSCKQ